MVEKHTIFYLITQVRTLERGRIALSDKWAGSPESSARVDRACEFASVQDNVHPLGKERNGREPRAFSCPIVVRPRPISSSLHRPSLPNAFSDLPPSPYCSTLKVISSVTRPAHISPTPFLPRTGKTELFAPL